MSNRICNECHSMGQRIEGGDIILGLHLPGCTQAPENRLKSIPSLLQIQNHKGEVILDIPYPSEQRDFTPEELFEIIAKQTESYWREKIAGERG